MIKRKATLILFFFLSIMGSGYTLIFKVPGLFNIPTQTLNLHKVLGINSNTGSDTIEAFQISRLVTFKEYKEYLLAIKKDSSEKYYLSQLPDTNIGPEKVYREYISNSVYDDFPVLGISWDNAMNFCRWKTLNENKGEIQFIYRLPLCVEWLAAYNYLDKQSIENDFNKNYSDWLLNAYDESYSDCSPAKKNSYPFTYSYFHKKNDPLVLKRKSVIGDSYLFQREKLSDYRNNYFYATQGYRHIAFRYVKSEKIDDNLLKYWGLKK